ncbi:hypothetical protein [Nitrospira calida]
MLKVGHLVLFTVCKAWPEASAVLVWLEPAGPFALLPRTEADRAYKVGDTGFAAVREVVVPYPRLSQRTPHYIRRIAELVLSPLRAEHRLAVTRVAYRPGWPRAKVLVRCASPEVLKEAVGLLPAARAHLSVRLVLVPKEDELLAQVRAALYPAPPEAVRAAWPDGRPRHVLLDVDPLARGAVLGARGANLRAAAALLRKELELIEHAAGGNTCTAGAASGGRAGPPSEAEHAGPAELAETRRRER